MYHSIYNLSWHIFKNKTLSSTRFSPELPSITLLPDRGFHQGLFNRWRRCNLGQQLRLHASEARHFSEFPPRSRRPKLVIQARLSSTSDLAELSQSWQHTTIEWQKVCRPTDNTSSQLHYNKNGALTHCRDIANEYCNMATVLSVTKFWISV